MHHNITEMKKISTHLFADVLGIDGKQNKSLTTTATTTTAAALLTLVRILSPNVPAECKLARFACDFHHITAKL
ncbi:hypothetical protein T07_11528 [Trichinella nelsoni]|uniref:Uncharacterized protein n=1 Tax=Trichinella nelsoni TaxID=6336 RepID=A0A0V0RWH3_9BILA|nr:hypothetical protein T07_11528 [Trichinella nelsoni]